MTEDNELLEELLEQRELSKREVSEGTGRRWSGQRKM